MMLNLHPTADIDILEWQLAETQEAADRAATSGDVVLWLLLIEKANKLEAGLNARIV